MHSFALFAFLVVMFAAVYAQVVLIDDAVAPVAAPEAETVPDTLTRVRRHHGFGYGRPGFGGGYGFGGFGGGIYAGGFGGHGGYGGYGHGLGHGYHHHHHHGGFF